MKTTSYLPILKAFIFNQIMILFLIFVPFKMLAQQDWTLKKDKNGIKVYTKDHENEKIKFYRLNTSFKADMEDVFKFNTDFDNYENWVKNCEKSEVISSSKNEIIYYSKYKTPWPADDRDFITKVSVKRHTENEILLTMEPANYDYPKEDGVVRVTNFLDKWKITTSTDNVIQIETEGYYDPGGSIPAWIVNMFMVDGPYHSMLTLKEKTEREN